MGETKEIQQNLIQFRIDENYYELYLNKKKDWVLNVVFGKNIKFSTKKLKGLNRDTIVDLLKIKFPKIRIY